MWDSISTQGRDQSCVNGQLSPVENGQPLCDHFKATTVNTTQRAKSRSRTKILVETRAPASRQMRAADSSAKPRLPSTPEVEHAARWWPRTSRGRPHRQVRDERGRGRRRRWKRRTRKSTESNRWCMEVGETMKGKPEKGPPCDRKRAHCAGEERGTMEWKKKEFSTLADASNCQPWAGTPGSFPWCSTFARKRGRASAAACHSGGTNPPRTDELQPARFSSLQMSTFCGTGQRAHHQSSDVRVSLMDHPEAVRPTGPICGFLGPGGASKPTTSWGQKQWGQILCMLGETCPKEPREARLRCNIMLRRELCNILKWDTTDPIIGPSVGATQQEQPRTLKVLHNRDAVKQDKVQDSLLADLGTH